MPDYQDRVLVFHEMFGALINNKPTVLPEREAALRMRLIREEVDELEEAFVNDDLVGITDALGDILYVVFGAAVSHGIQLGPVFDEIHRSNMTKVWPGGEVVTRADGKILKPPTFSKPDIEGILKDQGWTPPPVSPSVSQSNP